MMIKKYIYSPLIHELQTKTSNFNMISRNIFKKNFLWKKRSEEFYSVFFAEDNLYSTGDGISQIFFFLSISIKTIHWTCWRMIIICYIICIIMTSINKRLSWSWSYGSWINNYLCNQCLSPLMLWVRTLFMVRYTRYNIMWWFVGDLWQVCSFFHQ